MSRKKMQTGDAAIIAAADEEIVVVMPDDLAQVDPDADVDISQEDRDELTRLAGEVLRQDAPPTEHLDANGEPAYRFEFAQCLYMALGERGLHDRPDHIDVIPFELACFFRNEPTAPTHAGLMHLKLKLKTNLLPHEDPRRVELALQLFRTAILGLDAIETQDLVAQTAKDASAFKPAHDRLDGDGPYDRDGGRFELSDTGKALAAQHPTAVDPTAVDPTAV